MDSMNMTDTGDMSNTTSTDSSGSMSMMIMKAYLHFTPGDTVIFKTIVPTSAGAIFGTCLILFLVSVGERYLRAVCRGINRRLAQRAKRLATVYSVVDAGEAATASGSKHSASKVVTPAPAAPSFILSRQLSRGLLAGIESTLHYLLMLVVMTFNAAFIISVVLGVVMGEMAFGRLNR
ncbi:Ctr copper transporter [Mycena albidolilacea]|uniref:Copper transport protein n=1 Tax=Mycena albidolilacea TaxID=1033008 RepID=A0AAD7AB43_9AGAR|nr:Ctr copper transporter [Mycena albidolilacea]